MDTSGSEKNATLYSDEELSNIAELLDVLQAIRRRLLTEGIPIDQFIAELQKLDKDV